MSTRRWFECWGGPALVVAIILISTLVATLVLRELRPCGWLDAVLRENGGLCTEMVVSEPCAGRSSMQFREMEPYGRDSRRVGWGIPVTDTWSVGWCGYTVNLVPEGNWRQYGSTRSQTPSGGDNRN
jgi:hypothetical protein